MIVAHTKNVIGYINILRVVATLVVVLLHLFATAYILFPEVISNTELNIIIYFWIFF
jgi:hypothetical protein